VQTVVSSGKKRHQSDPPLAPTSPRLRPDFAPTSPRPHRDDSHIYNRENPPRAILRDRCPTRGRNLGRDLTPGSGYFFPLPFSPDDETRRCFVSHDVLEHWGAIILFYAWRGPATTPSEENGLFDRTTSPSHLLSRPLTPFELRWGSLTCYLCI
jgi:hypothetical protein